MTKNNFCLTAENSGCTKHLANKLDIIILINSIVFQIKFICYYDYPHKLEWIPQTYLSSFHSAFLLLAVVWVLIRQHHCFYVSKVILV